MLDGLGERGFDLLVPRRFSQVIVNDSEMRATPSKKCNMFVDDFANAVEENHLYMEQSLSTSYTAAFYDLVQNGVERKSLNASTASSSSSAAARSPPQLAFAGNLQQMNVQVRFLPQMP